MPDRHTLPEGSRPSQAIRNNGPNDLALERFKLRELAEGWPMYRDACEWENFASIFHSDAHIYTTWSGRVHFQKFIEISKAGMDKGAFIMHRCNGASTDIRQDSTRAVTKMKAVITQRFALDGCEVDVEADCRFCYLWERDSAGDWKARLVRHWYEKDRMIPVNPNKVTVLDDAKLAQYSPGYAMLAYCQEATMEGIKVLHGLPGHRREDEANLSRKAHDKLYWQCKKWLDGEEIRPEGF
ncbi:Vacuolar protease A [Lithohypha guttulata]|uniref:Vacuolar protease A n=1 Tax=Lithohypha guttulata TaxID=1690604 RepID=A0AAN7STS6_9EURO|nr:Vacuolar protease A [Lithohypha guttulata]